MATRISLTGGRDAAVRFVADFLHLWLELLSNPCGAIQKARGCKLAESTRLRKAIAYASTALVAAMCIAELMRIKDSASLLTPKLVVGGILFWSVTGLLIHLVVRLVARGKESVAATVAVFLYMSETLLVLWIAIFAVCQQLFAGYDTTLTLNTLSSTGWIPCTLKGATPYPGETVAAIDRLVHHSTIFELNVESYRPRKASDKQTERLSSNTPRPTGQDVCR
jgi:hypothetical protein